MGSPPPAETQYATYLPHDLPYSAPFEDSLIPLLLPSSPSTTATQPPNPPTPTSTPPSIHESELPLPPQDPRRTFPSPLPPLLLTHPRGYLQGGPPLDPALDTFATDFLTAHAHEIHTVEDLESVQRREIEGVAEVLRERLRRRREMLERNESVRRELRVLGDQHGMEVRVRKKLAEEARVKREGRERRRREREGG